MARERANANNTEDFFASILWGMMISGFFAFFWYLLQLPNDGEL